MNKAAFTICAKNYIGLAQTLGESIKKYSPDVEYYIFVSDEFTYDERGAHELPQNTFIAREVVDIPTNEWYQMAFKYDLTEFATAIKPSCFKYLFENFEIDRCIFFDPDILVFDTLDKIYNQLDDYSIMLTPHITTIQDIYTGSIEERSVLYSGMYNLGFLALKYNEHTQKLLSWWKIRLKDRCFQNVMENYFTDQKWMDFIPSFFPSQVNVSHNIGMNLAPWNFYEREVIKRGDIFFVRNRIYPENYSEYALTFVHFSGFDYRALLSNEVAQGKIKNLEVPEDIKGVLIEYTDWLKRSGFAKFIELGYTYNYYENYTPISSVHRRLFRRLVDDGKISDNPFDHAATFYQALKTNKLLDQQMITADKTAVGNIANADGKAIMINKAFNLLYKLIGARRFFLMVRAMRIYSKIENHVYVVDKSYFKKFKVWS